MAAIEAAFSASKPPNHLVEQDHPETDEYSDALAFQGKTWMETACSDWEQYPAAVFGFSPEAFCYYLPGIYSAGIRENRPDLLVNYSLIGMLNRSNTPSSWDDFFIPRWPQLTTGQCEATQKWLLWLVEFDPPPIEDVALSRSFETVSLLAAQKGATPLAMKTPKRK